jgi:hypothetical protein
MANDFNIPERGTPCPSSGEAPSGSAQQSINGASKNGAPTKLDNAARRELHERRVAIAKRMDALRDTMNGSVDVVELIREARRDAGRD